MLFLSDLCVKKIFCEKVGITFNCCSLLQWWLFVKGNIHLCICIPWGHNFKSQDHEESESLPTELLISTFVPMTSLRIRITVTVSKFEKFSVFSWALRLLSCPNHLYSLQIYFSLFNHIKPAGELKNSSDYSLFKKGIRPMWEDDANKNGGRWLINIDKPTRDEINLCWLELVSEFLTHHFSLKFLVCPLFLFCILNLKSLTMRWKLMISGNNLLT